jgi:hypothetical protein
MLTPTARSPAQILRSRGIGVCVGTLIGVAWFAYGLSLLAGPLRIVLAIGALVIAALLLRQSRRLIAASRRLPAPDDNAVAANRHTWIKFWINLVFEIVLLNVAINLLQAPPLHVYWIPAISLVVGLHFLPMARFMNVPSYWICGGVMIAVAGMTAIGINAGIATPTMLIAIEALSNAIILWVTVGWGIRSNARLAMAGTGD